MKLSTYLSSLAFCLILILAACGPNQPPPNNGTLNGPPPDRAQPPQAPAPDTENSSGTVRLTTDDQFRYVEADGLPNHETGDFPNNGNPHSISAQNYSFRMSLNPEMNAQVTPFPIGKFGIALNGIPFDPGAAEFWNRDQNSGWQYEALSGAINLGLDQNNAHVQPTGAYHYHGIPTVLAGNGSSHSPLIGYAADGFPVYIQYGYADPVNSESDITEMRSSYRLKTGTRPDGPGGEYDGTFVQDYEYVEGVGDLDECNGRITVTREYPDGTYAYFLTDEFPFIPRCWRGTPDQSFRRR